MSRRCLVSFVCSAVLVVGAQSATAQPPPTGIGNGADGPRGMPTETRPDRPRGLEERRGGRQDAQNEEIERLRRELEPEHRDRAGRVHERFRWEEREAIGQWYREREARPSPGVASGQRELPPGLQRRLARGGDLPPGWQRKVERGEVLSQEQVRHGRRVDEELRRRLPPQPDGTVIMETEDQVIRVLEATGEVLDVLGIGR
ncbi:hypothetical protein [Thioalkalivibrio denitrificans]|uniref:hypothetical protein n=1 Tax=Thioalkalivibrio denitrificans TaxID=108003 RepID=UPI001FE7DD52|nr:hypothetical protein [Thioalkalivibrio denitrificans]